MRPLCETLLLVLLMVSAACPADDSQDSTFKSVQAFLQFNRTEAHHKRAVAVAAIAVGAVSTVAAYRYMSLAEGAYGRYLQAGNPEKMDHYFSLAKTYDQKAGFSFAVFEISFFLAVFSFFSSLSP